MILLPIFLFSFSASLATYVVLRVASHQSIRLQVSLSPHTADWFFYALALAYALVFSALSILRHLAFNTDGYDMTIFAQVIWNSLRGRLFENTIIPDAPLLIGQRFSPILLAFVPLYAVWSSPVVLMIVQALALAFGAFPLYWFARARVGHLLALAVAASYFLFPALEFTNLREFHEIALAVPLLSLAAFFLLRQRYKPLLVCLGLSLLVKEDMAFVVIAFGAYLLLVLRKRWLGLGIAVFGLIWSVLLLQYILPFLRGDQGFGAGYYYFGHGFWTATERYGYLGRSLFEIITTIVTRPDIVLQHVFVAPKIEFVLYLLIPCALLPLIGAEIAALALPTLSISLLSDYDLQFSIESHYTASLLPFLFFAMVIASQRILTWRAKTDRGARRAALAVLILGASGGSYYLQAPGPLAQRFAPALYALNAHTDLGHTLLSVIPADAVVVAQGGLTPHLAERQGIYGFPSLDYCRSEYLVGDTTRMPYQLFEKAWEQWMATGYFEILKQQDGFFIAKRHPPDRSLDIRFDDQLTLLKYTAGTTVTLRGGQSLCPILEWHADQNIRQRYIIQVHVLDAQGHLFARDEDEPNGGFSPINQWTAGQTIIDYRSIRLPPTMPPGVYQITVGVFDLSSNRLLGARDPAGERIDDEPMIGTLRIEKDTSSVTAHQLQIEQPYFVDMQEIRLLGFTFFPKSVAPGDTHALGVYWRARGKPRGDYQVTVQLSQADGRVVLEQSDRPAAGAYPTPLWNVGEVLLDWHDLALPRELREGEYTISVLLRNLTDQTVLGEAPVTTITVKK